MGRTIERLSALEVKRLETAVSKELALRKSAAAGTPATRSAQHQNPVSKRGLYADGGGLYLQIDRAGSISWIFRYMTAGRTRSMGLGPLRDVSLAKARQKAGECRAQRVDGVDPLEDKRAVRAGARLAAAKAKTFDACRDEFIASHKAGWRNPKHVRQWGTTLATYATLVFGRLPVQDVDTALVMKAIQPIWTTKPETAGRVRGRIESVLNWATVSGYRKGENPARWRGHIDQLLPQQTEVRRVVHYRALPYVDMPDFMRALAAQDGIAARALEFTILTAARTGETIGATWAEFDLAEKVWTISGERMKAGKDHRAPLAGRALVIADSMQPHRGPLNRFVFPGGKRGHGLSNMAMAAVLERMGRDTITVHGFRSSFRDWAAEQTNFPNQVVEMALAHAIGDKVEAAYRRGDLMEKRRRLMEEWARYCDPNDLLGNIPVMMREAVE